MTILILQPAFRLFAMKKLRQSICRLIYGAADKRGKQGFTVGFGFLPIDGAFYETFSLEGGRGFTIRLDRINFPNTICSFPGFGGKGIPFDCTTGRELKLDIEDFGCHVTIF
jgi:hypothetical protein